MQTVLTELKEVLEREIKFVGGLRDNKENKTVADYLRTVIKEIDTRFMLLEKKQIVDAFDEGYGFGYGDNGETGERYFIDTFTNQ